MVDASAGSILFEEGDPADGVSAILEGVVEVTKHGRILATLGVPDARIAADYALTERRLGPLLTEDVCVPRAAVPEMLARIQATGERFDTTIANLAHAGDGNLHPLLITPVGDEPARERAQAAFEQILADALDLGGTITGEHGVGLLKRHGLAAEQSPEALAMQRAVKAALDPHGILNPGKVL